MKSLSQYIQENKGCNKEFPITGKDRDSWRIELCDGKLRINYINRIDSYYSTKYNTIATKTEPTAKFLYWNKDDKELINYLKKQKIGKYTTKTEPNYDEDPYGKRIVRGERTWYKFDFTELFNNINEQRTEKEGCGTKLIHDDDKVVGTIVYLALFNKYVLEYNHDWLVSKNGNIVIHPKGMKKETFNSKKEAVEFAKKNNIEIVYDTKIDHPLAHGLPDTRAIRSYQYKD